MTPQCAGNIFTTKDREELSEGWKAVEKPFRTVLKEKPEEEQAAPARHCPDPGMKYSGNVPKCGDNVVKGKFSAYCRNKCGMNAGRAMGAVLSDSQVKSMLEGKKTLVKGLKGKFDGYLIEM